MKLFKQLALTVALVLGLTTGGGAQITVPNTLQAGATIRASELNTNFTDIASKALNRISGGTIEGNVILSDNVTFDGVDISDFLTTTQIVAPTGGTNLAPAYSVTGELDTGIYFPAVDSVAITLGSTQRFLLNASGLTIYGVNIVNSSGKIPALTSTYFASLDGSNLTNIIAASATNFTGALAGDVEGTQGATSIAAGAIVNADINAAAAIVDTKLAQIATAGKVANSATTANTGAVADTIVLRDGAGAIAASGLTADAIAGDVFTVNTSIATPAFQLTTTPTAGHVLTSDASGNASWQASPTGTLGGSGTDQTIAMFDGDTVTMGDSVMTQVSGDIQLNSGSLKIGSSFPGTSASSTVDSLIISGVTPVIDIYETDGSVDGKFWRFIASDNILYLQQLTDAYVVEQSVLQVSSTGNITAGVKVITPALQVTGGTPGSGKVLTSDASGNATWSAAASVDEVPTGAILLFDTSCPSGYTRFSALDSKFPRGNSAYGATGGSDAHTHSFSDTSTTAGSHSHTFSETTSSDGPTSHSTSSGNFAPGAASAVVGVSAHSAHTHNVSGSTSSVAAHSHDVSGTSGSTGNLPPYLNMIFCKKN